MRIMVICFAVIGCVSVFADSSFYNVDVEVQKSSSKSGLLCNITLSGEEPYIIPHLTSKSEHHVLEAKR